MAREIMDYEEAKVIVRKGFLSDRLAHCKWRRHAIIVGISVGPLAYLSATTSSSELSLLFFIPIFPIIISSVDDIRFYYKYRKKIKDGTYFDEATAEQVIRQANNFIGMNIKIESEPDYEESKHM